MYIGGRGDEGTSRRGVKVPEQYSGSAFADKEKPDTEFMRAISDSDIEPDAVSDMAGAVADNAETGVADEALRYAVEAFRRGYVFDENKGDEPPEYDAGNKRNGANSTDAESAVGVFARGKVNASGDKNVNQSLGRDIGRKINPSVSSGLQNKNQGLRPQKKAAQEQTGGLLSGILSNISLETVLIGALIIMLWRDGTDDELLIMLAVLLLC